MTRKGQRRRKIGGGGAKVVPDSTDPLLRCWRFGVIVLEIRRAGNAGGWELVASTSARLVDFDFIPLFWA